MIALIIIFCSIFFYIVSAIPVIATYFVFGESFAIILKEKGLIAAISTYPHFLPETLSTMLLLSIAFVISAKMLKIVFKNESILKNKKKILKTYLVSNVLLIFAAFIEALKIGDRKLINEIYFVSIGSKLIFSTVAVLTLILATSWNFIFASVGAIILYIIYFFANKQNTISERTRKVIARGDECLRIYSYGSRGFMPCL
ncbi:hypothetical protein [Paenibacillus larvae]|uniref:hypothetical protein n=1 Tax=Paenibacillus larvae TaxID=1464 RepID=UPI002853A05A|nr:hypothetical protein [Paenibacillus larvae]MDR5601299.1 hypothetical protein [Paenibacillus larvae]